MFALIKDAYTMISDLKRTSPFMRIWGPLLNVPHVVGGLVFVAHFEALLILISALFSVIAAAQIHKRFSFSRMTSIVHIVWLPLLPFLLAALRDADLQSAYGLWLAFSTTTIVISLVLDMRNIFLFLSTRNNTFAGAET